jgi:GAF domain-containing protein
MKMQEKIHLLNSIITKVNTDRLDVDEIVTLVIYAIDKVIRAEDVSIYLYNPVTHEYKLKAQNEYPNRKVSITTLTQENSFIEHVLTAKEVLRINKENLEFVPGYLLKSILIVPLIYHQDSIGLLIVKNWNNKIKITSQDEYLLTLFSGSIVGALKNIELRQSFNEQARVITSLHQISNSLINAEHTNRRVLQDIANDALVVLSGDLIVILEYNEELKIFQNHPIIAGHKVYSIDRLKKRQLDNTDDSLVHKLLTEKKPFYASNGINDWINAGYLSKSKHLDTDGFFYREKVASSVGIPLYYGNKLGLMFVNYRTKKNFDDNERSIIETFSNYVMLSIRINRALGENVTYQNQLSILNKIGKEINLSNNLKEAQLYSRVFKGITEQIINISNFYIAHYDRLDNSVDFKFIIENGEVIKKKQDEWKKRFNGNGITEYIIRNNKPVIVNHGLDDWLSRERVDLVGHPAKSILGIPLKSGKQTIGAMVIQDYDREDIFNSTHIELIQTIGSYLAAAIRSKRNSRVLLERLTIIEKIIESMSTKLTTDELYKEIVEQISNELKCTHCTLYMYERREDKSEYLIPIVVSGKRKDKASILSRKFALDEKRVSSEGLIGFTFDTGSASIYHDAARHPRFSTGYKFPESHERSMLIAPVRSGGEIKALICADQDNTVWFTENDKKWVQGLASHIGVAIERCESLELLHDIGKQIIGSLSIGDFEDILLNIIQGGLKITEMEAGIIYLLGHDENTIVKEIKYPFNAYLPRPRRNENGLLIGITKEVIKRRKPVIIIDPARSRLASQTLKKNKQSIAGYPLIIDHKLIAVLFLVDSRRHDFTEIELSILSTLSYLAAQTIKSAIQIENQISIADSERSSVYKYIANDFIHRFGNLSGTIPRWANSAKHELVKLNISESEKVHQYLSNIITVSTDLLHQIQYDHNPNMVAQKVDTREVIDSLIAEFEYLCPPTVEFTTSCTGALKPVFCVRQLIDNALFNIIDNARKSISQIGKIDILLHPTVKNRTEYIVIEVSDSGKGIPDNVRSEIFNLGVSYWEEGSISTGYGLWRSKSIIQEFGGSIDFRSNDENGTTFIITLPACE